MRDGVHPVERGALGSDAGGQIGAQRGNVEAVLGKRRGGNRGNSHAVHFAALQGPGEFEAHHEVARRMAGAAMRQPFDKIGPPVPCGGALFVPRQLAVREVQQGPEVHERAHRQHKSAGIGLVGDRHGRNAHIVGVKRVNVVRRRELREDKGHCRIEIAIARRDAVAHHAMKIGARIVADAVLFVRRDVGRIQRAERRPYGQASGAHRPLRQRVAAEAVAGQSQFAPARNQSFHLFGRKSPLRLRGHARCPEQPEQNGERRHDNDSDDDEN